MNRLTVVAVAAVVALLSGVGLVRYVGGAEKRATASAELVPILTAAADVPEGTSFANAFGSGQVVWSKTLASLRPATAVLDTNAVTGMVANRALVRGQVVVDGEFVDPSAARRSGPPTFATNLPDGTVAVSFEAMGAQAVSDLITPGDHVNLLVQVPNAAELGLPDSGGPAVVHVFQDLLILAIGSTPAPPAGATQPAVNPGTGSYTVAVSPLDAARVLLLTRQYTVFLTLVGPGTTPSNQPPVDGANALPDTLTADVTKTSSP
ncbi:MAG: pilus assembly protein CpaB [Pseudonocardiales bacterium]|nr:pilus assembly protein CpaB [Pseudonocardiales bacterium]